MSNKKNTPKDSIFDIDKDVNFSLPNNESESQSTTTANAEPPPKSTFGENLKDFFESYWYLLVLGAFIIAYFVYLIASDVEGFLTKSLTILIIAAVVGGIYYGKKLYAVIKLRVSPKERFADKCKQVIEKRSPSFSIDSTPCTDIVIDKVKAYLATRSVGDNFTDVQVYRVLAYICFSLLSSGASHVYYGELARIGPDADILSLHRHCMKWLLDNGNISKEQYDDELDRLAQNISTVG